jgi:methionine--tRNA ligase beta chain
MKWTLTSPDGIGDFILRLPWLIKMQEKGWKLQLIARAPTLEMAVISGIEGEFVELSQSPYSMEAKCSIIPFKRDFRAIQKFNPELIFFGPSHPTFLEEKLTKKFPQIKKGGFVLKEGFWPSEGLENPRDLAKNYEFQLEISEWMSDFSRNQLACNFLLGYQETLSPYFLPQEKIVNSTTSDLNKVGNKYLADTEPWKLVKTDPKRVETIMHIALQITANLGLVLEPFLPETAAKIREFMNTQLKSWDQVGELQIQANHFISPPTILFPQIEDELVEREVALLHESKPVETNFTPQKENITFDDFSKLDIRLGTIIEAVKVPKADKLLQLTVNVGVDTRTIVSGIAAHYAPEEVVGKTVAVLLNLEPRKIRGVESQGMILMAEDNEGNLSFMVPEKGFDFGGEIR